MSSVGRRYRYVSRTGRQPWKDGERARYGQIVAVLAWHRSKVLVRFGDGHTAICPGRVL
jgi:hypothetical protein